jgi:hypothetical protein
VRGGVYLRSINPKVEYKYYGPNDFVGPTRCGTSGGKGYSKLQFAILFPILNEKHFYDATKITIIDNKRS